MSLDGGGIYGFCHARQDLREVSVRPLPVRLDLDGTKLNGDWPGTQMTQTVTIGNETWWVSDEAYGDAKAILNGGLNSPQTSDITITKDNNMFVYNGATDFYPVNQKDDGVFAYAVDNNSWSTMYAYAWKGGGDEVQ